MVDIINELHFADKESKRERKEEVIYCSVLPSSAHADLWSTLPSRAMLVLMSKHAHGPEPCRLLGPAGSSSAAQRAWGGFGLPVPKYARR